MGLYKFNTHHSISAETLEEAVNHISLPSVGERSECGTYRVCRKQAFRNYFNNFSVYVEYELIPKVKYKPSFTRKKRNIIY